MAECYSIVCVSEYVLYTYISHLHLGCFHVLVIVNNAAMNIGVRVSLQSSVFIFSGIYPGVELLGQMAVLFLVSFFFFFCLFMAAFPGWGVQSEL